MQLRYFLFALAAVYSGFFTIDVLQHLSMGFVAMDGFIVAVLLELAREAQQWDL